MLSGARRPIGPRARRTRPVTTIYLDNAATTPVAPAVRTAMAPFLEAEFGNPSTRYALGVRAAEAIDRARELVARAVGARAREVTFTSGGTEANNLAVLGLARQRGFHRSRRRNQLVIGPTEHPSVRASAFALRDEGFEVREARLLPDGGLDLEAFEELLTEDTVLVAQMLVNNEVGSVYPVSELARIVRRSAPNAALHVDAVQGLGKLELSIEELGADTLAISAHKVHAPKGTGALVTRGKVDLRPLVFGGGQESGRRPGTENVAGIVAFGEAARLADTGREEGVRAMAAARDAFVRGLERVPGARLLIDGSPVVPSICAIALAGAPAEVWLHHLEARGVCASAGSACNAGKKELSPVALALGLTPDEARRVMRFSFAAATTVAEAERAAALLAELATELEAVQS